MTRVDIDALERLEREATPGPWKSSPFDDLRPADCDLVLWLVEHAPAIIAELRELRAWHRAARIFVSAVRCECAYGLKDERIFDALRAYDAAVGEVQR